MFAMAGNGESCEPTQQVGGFVQGSCRGKCGVCVVWMSLSVVAMGLGILLLPGSGDWRRLRRPGLRRFASNVACVAFDMTGAREGAVWGFCNGFALVGGFVRNTG